MVQDKQDGLKPDETAGMSHSFSPDLDGHRGETGKSGKPEKARKALWCKHNISGLEDGWLECSRAGYVFARRWASSMSSASVKFSYR